MIVTLNTLALIDKTTENYEELEYARLLPIGIEAKMTKKLRKNSELYQIKVKEEHPCQLEKRNRECDNS